MRKIPHYMSWKAIFNTVVCFGKKICQTHEAVTIVTVLWVHKESLFTVIFRDCPGKQQLTQIDSLKVKGTSRTGDHCSFVSSFPLEQRQIKATRRKEKKAEDCTDGAIWAQTEITSDFNSWEMRWHQRNLICVIHNRKIGRNAASDRYSIFNMTVSFRSFQFFGATLCSTATSKINLYRLCDLEI